MNWESLGWMATALLIAFPWLRLAWLRARARRAATAAVSAKAVSP